MSKTEIVEQIWMYVKKSVAEKLPLTAPKRRWGLISQVLEDYYHFIDPHGYGSAETFTNEFRLDIQGKARKEFESDFFTMYFYYPQPHLGSKYIPGVNPSIVPLVHALLSWGVHTTGSHAGFFPGDEEEQEYWLNRQYFEEDGLGTHSGAIVCSQFVHAPPHVFFKASKTQLARLRQLLTPDWIIKVEPRPNHYKLEYTALQHFSDVTNQYWREFRRQVPYAALADVDDAEINAQYEAAMPLTHEEYQAKRTQAVIRLAQAIYQDIPQQDLSSIKARVDDYLITLEKYRHLELQVKYLEVRLRQQGIEP